MGVDGLIISDPGILSIAHTTVPDLPVHLSTQANVTNHASADFWLKHGAMRLNLARELSLKEIRQIRVMVEGEDAQQVSDEADQLASVVAQAI